MLDFLYTMHVDEGGAFSSQNAIKLEIVSARGETRTIEVTTDLGVEKLKLMALSSFHQDPLTSIKIAQQFKLVSINKKKTLVEEASLRDEEITDGDILLLLPRCILPNTSQMEGIHREMRGRGPSDGEIATATANVLPKNLDKKMLEPSNSLDFQKELRKILVSLIAFAERLLRTHPDVEPILREIKPDADVFEMQKKVDENINPEALQQLTDMGFPCERAKRALKLNNMSPLEAMDWLLAYESTATPPNPLAVPLPSTSAGVQTTSDTSLNFGIYPRVPAIVECYRSYKRKQFKPNSKAFSNMKQMGFDDNEVLDALWVHSNNEVAACEWLLSDRRPKAEDLRKGLKFDSPIYKAVISSATVQLGLVKPKIFFSFLQLLEEPNSTGKWLNDPETSPVLSQIFRIYHAEKHAAAAHIAVSGSASSSPEELLPHTSYTIS